MIAKEKWGKKNAKELIFETKKLHSSDDDEARKYVDEETIRQEEREKIRHEMALETVDTIFNDLSDKERLEAREYFDEIVE